MRRSTMMVAAALAPMLLTAGCGGKGGGNSSTGTAAAQTESQPEELMQDSGNTQVPVRPPSPSPVAAIPEGFRGRWGMVPDDCIKGGGSVLVVDAASLEVGGARLDARSLALAGKDDLTARITQPGGAVASERITLLDDGKTLNRQRQAPPASLQYSRCPA